MKKYKYGIIGSFSFGKQAFGGQSIKTINFADELERAVGSGSVLRTDTRGWKKHPFKLIRKVLNTIKNSEEVVILPADRGVLVIPGLVILLRGFRKNKLRYVVIGGWLPEFLEKRKWLRNILKRYDGIYVETESMNCALCDQGFSNIVVLPNFKKLNVVEKSELVYCNAEPYKLCMFSRVLKEKGIEIAIEAVKKVNDMLGRIAYALDIYGRVDDGYQKEFAEIEKNLPNYISYKGSVDGSKSTEIIKEYYALVFPTYFYGEGYPGTLLDAFSAGVPVIASDWRYNAEIVGDDKGILIEPESVNALVDSLVELNNNSDKLNSLKENCLLYADCMRPENVVKIFCEN